jgi:hypothetical protein
MTKRSSLPWLAATPPVQTFITVGTEMVTTVGGRRSVRTSVEEATPVTTVEATTITTTTAGTLAGVATPMEVEEDMAEVIMATVAV